MSAGKDAYEARKRDHKEQKAQMQKDQEVRDRREAQADEIIDLTMVAIKAFLKGEASFIVTDGPCGSKVVAFGLIEEPR